MEYKYYMEVNSYEHMLNAYEIAKLYNLKTLTGKPHNRLTARLLSEYNKKYNDPKLYYQTKTGLMRVWPKSVYEKVIGDFVKEHDHNTELTIEFSNKSHYCVIGEINND